MRYDYSRFVKAIREAQYTELRSRILGEVKIETRSYKDFIQDPKTGRMMGRKSSKKPEKSLTKSKKRVNISTSGIKLDKNKKPFRYPECPVTNTEYTYFIRNVNTYYKDKYANKKWCKYYSGELDTMFYFENHGFDDYCIYRKG